MILKVTLIVHQIELEHKGVNHMTKILLLQARITMIFKGIMKIE